MDLQPGLTVLVDDDEGSASAYLQTLHDPPVTVLLAAPPGDEWRADQLVEHAVEAPHLIGRPYRAMSSGERQRARLGTVLAQDGVLLLDEPFGYLDHAGILSVLRAVRGRTVVAACTADTRVHEHADRLLVVENGVARPA